MSSSSRHPLLKFIVIACFLFLIGGFVAYNSGLFSTPGKPEPRAPHKTVFPIIVPPKAKSVSVPIPIGNRDTTLPKDQKTADPVKTVDPSVEKRRDVVIPGSKSAIPVPERKAASINPSADTSPVREVYFPSSKSMPVKFEIKPEGHYQLKQQKQRKR
jgi:hypothetical protein